MFHYLSSAWLIRTSKNLHLEKFWTFLEEAKDSSWAGNRDVRMTRSYNFAWDHGWIHRNGRTVVYRWGMKSFQLCQNKYSRAQFLGLDAIDVGVIGCIAMWSLRCEPAYGQCMNATEWTQIKVILNHFAAKESSEVSTVNASSTFDIQVALVSFLSCHCLSFIRHWTCQSHWEVIESGTLASSVAVSLKWNDAAAWQASLPI